MGLPRQVNCISDQPCPLAPCWTYQAGPEDSREKHGEGVTLMLPHLLSCVFVSYHVE